jgi:hypothetical protein
VVGIPYPGTWGRLASGSVLVFWVDFFPVDLDRAFAMFSPFDQGADNN